MSNKYSSQGLLSAREARETWLEGNLLVRTLPLGSTAENSFLTVGLSSSPRPFHTAGASLLRTMSTDLSTPTPGLIAPTLSAGSFSPRGCPFSCQQTLFKMRMHLGGGNASLLA